MKQKSFEEIYNSINLNVGDNIEKLRKSALRKKYLAFVVVVLLWVAILLSGFTKYVAFLIFSFIFSIIIFLYIIIRFNKEYRKNYKEQVINEIVKQSSPNLFYEYSAGISQLEYAESNFEFGWDKYNSEDKIEGELEDGVMLKMAQVHTEDIQTTTDSNGNTTNTYITKFFGLFGIITLKTSTEVDFMITNNSKFAKFSKNRMEMESAEFEKIYDVYVGIGKDKNNASRQNVMEILTPETIENLVYIRNLFKTAINVRVFKNKIYFRVELGDIFEPPTFKKSINFETLKRYFLIVDMPRMLYETLIDNILLMYGNKEEIEKRKIDKMNNSNT